MGIVPAVRPVGDRAVLVELPGNATVRKLAAQLPGAMAGLEDVVAGHDTVLITWERGRQPPGDLRARLAALLGGPSPSAAPEHLEVEVVYDGPDLAETAEALNLSPEALVRRHQATRFEVGFVGFSPGFAYLLGSDQELRPRRRRVPRLQVPARSLAIAGEYTAIYPAVSPGGWNLIGRALVDPFDAAREPQSLLRTGMTVSFVDPA
jgi:KipI family sensor histidine kinase inhibitor